MLSSLLSCCWIKEKKKEQKNKKYDVVDTLSVASYVVGCCGVTAAVFIYLKYDE
jgi:hypothetical protein